MRMLPQRDLRFIVQHCREVSLRNDKRFWIIYPLKIGEKGSGPDFCHIQSRNAGGREAFRFVYYFYYRDALTP
jgi:hypothetical protein